MSVRRGFGAAIGAASFIIDANGAVPLGLGIKYEAGYLVGHTMMLVLEINGGLLHLFSSAAGVESYVEAIDIQNSEYEFCDDTGQRFVGEIIQPTGLFRSGRVRLVPVGVPDQTLVASFISRARTLERGCDGFQTLDDLRRAHAA